MGKNQNKLRPEDIEKIDFVYTQKRELDKYSRLVDKDEIVEKHEYNLNIRRYVDNAPPPEPHDVRAHLHGGVPKSEVDSLERFWVNYPDLPKRCFQARANTGSSDKGTYLDFTDHTEFMVLYEFCRNPVPIIEDPSVATRPQGSSWASHPGF